LAFSKEILGHVGFVSLVQIKEKFEEKDQKCEVQTAGEMGGKNFIQNCRRVNAEKIQINVGDKVIITISNTGNVGIGTVNPSQKLDVAGYVKGTGLCIGNDCRTSWLSGFDCVELKSGFNFYSESVSCPGDRLFAMSGGCDSICSPLIDNYLSGNTQFCSVLWQISSAGLCWGPTQGDVAAIIKCCK